MHIFMRGYISVTIDLLNMQFLLRDVGRTYNIHSTISIAIYLHNMQFILRNMGHTYNIYNDRSAQYAINFSDMGHTYNSACREVC